ncbi:MAG TPA: SUMF1/EgtB/PvdO family nonheme iron enzyme [Phycisphaerales bacterium]|nr:SUMF1/EgtB/PvdO family nonheme iron enzyme [Phycisphaerales bacterium]
MGKHPAWPDFIDDAGTHPAAVIAARDALWTRGLQRACQLGAFEQVGEGAKQSFAHDAIVSTDAGTCVARVWASMDAKGKPGWPMIAMAHGEPMDASWLCEVAPPRLYAAATMAAETRSRQLVALSLGEAARQIEDTLAMVVGVPRASVSDGALLAQADANKIGAAMELLRDSLTPDARGDVGAVLRLPRLLADAKPLDNARMWLAALRGEVEPTLPIVLLERDASKTGDAWVDVIVGHGRSERWSIVRDGAARDSLAGRPAPAPATLARLKQTRDALGKRVRGATTPAVEKRETSKRSVALLLGGAALVVATAAIVLATRGSGFGKDVQPPDVFAQPRGGASATLRDPEQVATDGDRVNARDIASALAAVEAESAAQGVDVPAELVQRANAVVASDARDENDGRETLRLLEARRSELAATVLAEIRSREVDPSGLDEAERTLADAWRARLGTFSPRDGVQAVRERLEREEVVMTVAMDALRATRPDDALVKDEPVLAQAVASVRQSHATMLAGLVREGADRDRVQRVANELRDAAASLTKDDAATGRVDRVPALRQAARDGLARGAAWSELEPVHAALADATAKLDATALASDELRRMEAVRRVAQLPKDQLLEAMRAASADASGGRIAEVMQAWRRMAGEGVPVDTLAAAYEQVVKPAIEHVADESAKTRLAQEAARRARDAWIMATRDETDDAQLLERERLAKELDAQPPARSGEDVPAWSRAQARLAAAKLRREIAQDADDATVLERAKTLVEHVDAAGDALGTWPDAKRLRAIAQLSRDAIAQAAGEREWIGKAGPGNAGWKLADVRDDGVVRFVANDGTSVEFARQEPSREPASEAVYVARGEVSVGEVIALLRDGDAKREVLGALWRFDPQADPRVGPRAWVWTSGTHDAITVPRAWHAPLAGGGAPSTVPGVNAGAPNARTPMNYVSFRAAEDIAQAMGCRLLTVDEWRGLARDGAVNGPDATWKLQDAFATRTGVKAASARGDTGWGAVSASENDDGALWMWPSDRGQESAMFANVRGNVAEWLADGTIAGGSAMTAEEGPVRVSMGDALRGFADVGLRVAFSVRKDIPTQDAIKQLRQRGRD